MPPFNLATLPATFGATSNIIVSGSPAAEPVSAVFAYAPSFLPDFVSLADRIVAEMPADALLALVVASTPRTIQGVFAAQGFEPAKVQDKRTDVMQAEGGTSVLAPNQFEPYAAKITECKTRGDHEGAVTAMVEYAEAVHDRIGIKYAVSYFREAYAYAREHNVQILSAGKALREALWSLRYQIQYNPKRQEEAGNLMLECACLDAALENADIQEYINFFTRAMEHFDKMDSAKGDRLLFAAAREEAARLVHIANKDNISIVMTELERLARHYPRTRMFLGDVKMLVAGWNVTAKIPFTASYQHAANEYQECGDTVNELAARKKSAADGVNIIGDHVASHTMFFKEFNRAIQLSGVTEPEQRWQLLAEIFSEFTKSVLKQEAVSELIGRLGRYDVTKDIRSAWQEGEVERFVALLEQAADNAAAAKNHIIANAAEITAALALELAGYRDAAIVAWQKAAAFASASDTVLDKILAAMCYGKLSELTGKRSDAATAAFAAFEGAWRSYSVSETAWSQPVTKRERWSNGRAFGTFEGLVYDLDKGIITLEQFAVKVSRNFIQNRQYATPKEVLAALSRRRGTVWSMMSSGHEFWIMLNLMDAVAGAKQNPKSGSRANKELRRRINRGEVRLT